MGSGRVQAHSWGLHQSRCVLNRCPALLAEPVAKIMAKTGPVAAIVATTAVVWLLDLQSLGVNIVGAVPQGSYELVAFVCQLLLGHRASFCPLQQWPERSLCDCWGLGRGRCKVFAR